MPILLIRDTHARNILQIRAQNSDTIAQILRHQIIGLHFHRCKLSAIQNMAEDVLSKGLQLPDQAFDEKELDQIQVENFMTLCLPKCNFLTVSF